MMKWLRKHNRMLLMVFMAFLMIVFVGGQALENLLSPNQGGDVVFKTSLGDITVNDRQIAQSETFLLEQMGARWQRPAGFFGEQIALPDWITLKREALLSGYQPSVAVARASFTDQGARDQIENRARQLRVKPEAFYQAFANWDIVSKAGNAVARSYLPSEAEIRAQAKAALDKVRISVVLLHAKAFMDREQEFTTEELQAHFDKYKAVQSGKGGGEFGYFRGHAVKIGYIKIDHDAIAAEVRSKAELSDALQEQLWREARQHHSTHIGPGDYDYRKPPGQIIAAEREPGSPVSPEAPKSPYFSWEDAKDKAYGFAIEARANQSVERIGAWLIRRLTEPWIDSERGDDQYKKPPPGVTEPGFLQAVVDSIPGKIKYPTAVSVGTTGFFTQDKVLEVPDIGRAYFSTANQLSKSLGRFAFQSQGVVPAPRGASPLDYLARYQPCRYLLRAKREKGNGFIFRMLDVRDPRPAESIDEVYKDVVRDLRIYRGLETARRHAQALMDAARETGSLDTAFGGHDELKTLSEAKLTSAMVRFVSPPPFARLDLEVPSAERDQGFVKIEGLGNIPRDLAERIYELADNPDPLTVLELPAWPAVMVIQWHESIPGTQEEFENLRGGISQNLMIERRFTALREWFDPEKIRARNDFKQVQ